MTYKEFCDFVRREDHETLYDDSEGRRIVVIRMLDLYALFNEMAKLPPVQVSLEEFLMRVEGHEELIGNPVIWAQWPTKQETKV